MREIPFIRNNIAENMWNNFVFYFMYDDFVWHFLAVVFFLVLNCLIVRFFFVHEKVIDESVLTNDKAVLSARIACFLSVVAYVINIFSLDLGIFNNYDQMVANNISDMLRGTLPIINSMRFNPIAGIDHNIIYGISHNYTTIAVWVIMKQLICLWLLYRILVEVSSTRRLFMIAIINFMPAVFWVNGIVYSEQNTLIFILTSLYFLKKYSKNNFWGNLFGFIFFANLAIYSKETNILFYFGIWLFLVLKKVFNEQITLKSFISPIKNIRKMPVEYLLFISMFIFSVYYLWQKDLFTDGAYVRHHQKELSLLLKINAPELLICFLALITFFRKLFKREYDRINLMEEGTLLGSFFVVGCIIFYLKIACFPDNYKTWYMYLPSIFVVYYLFKNNGTKAIIVLSIIIVTVSLIKNLDIYSKETGKERAELANVIVSKIKKPAVFYVNIENNDELWKFECFNSALKYLYPNENIIFKINYKPHPKMCDENVYFLTERNDVGVGDYFIVRKYDNSEILPDTRELIFENKVYQLYLIK